MDNLIFACLFFIVMDIILGLAGAARNKCLSSSIMREGLYNKFGEIMLLVIAVVSSHLFDVYPLSEMGVPSGIGISAGMYICSMELLSCLENVCKINPELPFSRILYIFNIPIDSQPEDVVESNSAHEE